jgi:hypothetical protein
MPKRFPPEVHEPAVRLMLDHVGWRARPEPEGTPSLISAVIRGAP